MRGLVELERGLTPTIEIICRRSPAFSHRDGPGKLALV